MAGHPGQAEYWNPGTWQLHLGKCLPSHKFKWHSSDKWQLQQVIIMWQAKYAEIGHESLIGRRLHHHRLAWALA